MPEETKAITLPPEAQQLLIQMQTFQSQYQTIALQKETLTLQKVEVERGLEELQKTKDKEEVFKIVGPILVRSTKAELVKELSGKKEMTDMRLKNVDKQEEKLREKLQETQEKLEKMFKGIVPSSTVEAE